MYLCDQVNVCKTKALTNMRASGSDDAIKLVPPLELNLDIAVEYIQVRACGMLCLPCRCVRVRVLAVGTYWCVHISIQAHITHKRLAGVMLPHIALVGCFSSPLL
jgi:hypothetical protein